MIDKGLIDAVTNAYGFYRSRYVIMSPRYTKTVQHYFTDKVIESHLEGRYALSVFAGGKATRFLCIDVDEGGKRTVRKVMEALVKMGVPKERIYISMSGKKGYHVEIFFDPWLYNSRAKNLYDLMIWISGLNPKKVEYRPTARQSAKVPLGIHAETGKRCWYLDRETLEPIESMEYIKEVRAIPADEVRAIVGKWNRKRWNELYAEMVCGDDGGEEGKRKRTEINDEYYEKRRITESGTRHNVMVGIACDLRRSGMGADGIAETLTEFYRKQDASFIETNEKKVMKDIGEIAKWAEKNVSVRERREDAQEGMKRIEFNGREIAYILLGPTNATRKVAFLLWAYCKVYGEAHVSYATIAKTVGCVVATAETAVDTLVGGGIIVRKSGGCHYRDGRLIRTSNTYSLPEELKLAGPEGAYSFCEKITPENFASIYYRTLVGVCGEEYLARFLTKPEMKKVKAEYAGKSECNDAGRGPGVSDVSGQPGDCDGSGKRSDCAS